MFNLNLTRQLISPDAYGDDDIWQLQLDFRFTPSEQLRKLGEGDQWCESPAQLEAFKKDVQNSEAYQFLAGLKAPKTNLYFEHV